MLGAQKEQFIITGAGVIAQMLLQRLLDNIAADLEVFPVSFTPWE